LADRHLHLQLVPRLLDDLDELRVAGGAVLVRFAGAETAEVGAVEHLDGHELSSATADQAASSQAGSGSVRIVGLPSPWRTTKRSDAPRAFLSTRITACSRSQSPV